MTEHIHTQSLSLEEEMEKKNFFFLYYMPNDRTSRTQHPDCVVKTLVIPLWVRDVVSQPVTLVIAFNI